MGVMMPSVDRVGRHFPFAIAAAFLRVEDSADDGGHWFGRAEALLLAALDSPLDLDGFDPAVAALGAPAGSDAAAALMPVGTAPAINPTPDPALAPPPPPVHPHIRLRWT